MTTTYAITDAAAKTAFSAANYAALENGDVHTLTFAEVRDASEAHETVDAAIAYLRANGGGWYFDDDLCSYWVTPIAIGDRVEGGEGEDHDTGRIERIDGPDRAYVAWDSGVKTPANISALRVIE